MTKFESEFQQNVGIIIGIQKHLDSENTEKTKIEILTQEALSTSSIEGEILQRDSVQSSIRKHFGLKTDNYHFRIFLRSATIKSITKS